MIHEVKHQRRLFEASFSFCGHAAFRAAPIAGMLIACLLLVGCPPDLKPEIQTSPGALDFSTTSERESFTILNTGGLTLTWTLTEVVWDAATQTWVAQDVAWLSVEDGITNGTTTTKTDRVFLLASRAGLAPGMYGGTGIRVDSNASNYQAVVIPLSMTVAGHSGEGEGEGEGEEGVAINPTTLHINGLTSTGVITVTNNTGALVQWSATVTLDSTTAPEWTPIQIALSPTQAATQPGDSTEIVVGIPDPETFDSNYLTYIVSIFDRTSGALYGEVPVGIELINPSVVAIDPTVLNFGTESYQLSFWVANLGDVNSRMDFGIFQLVPGTTDTYIPYDVQDDPLIAVIRAPEGMDDVLSDVEHITWIYAREVAVTIDRDGIEEDLEYRPLYIGVVSGTDAQGNPVMDTTVEPAVLQVRVESAPYVEGATNRARPPSVQRFVFTLRDKRGIAVDETDPLTQALTSFYVTEDTFPLDLDETSLFVDGPENLTCNVELLLDFTGSMYMAGTRDPLNPMQPGEAIDIMVAAAKQFVMDLPEGYRLGIMEYHDVGQTKRVIHGFDANKDSLVTALDKFSLPVAEHGSSMLFDAVYEASLAVLFEDATQSLPFDDTDLRCVVFISDGWDTSSIRKMEEVKTLCKDGRIRVFPIGFSGSFAAPVNDFDLIPLGAETGGHVYHAIEAGDLAKLLDTERSLAFGRVAVDLRAKTATLEIRNKSANPLTWSISNLPNFVTASPMFGTMPAIQRDEDGVITETGARTVTLTLVSPLAAGAYEGLFNLTSNDGDGTVKVTANVDGAGNVTSFRVVPHSEDVGRIWRELRSQIVLTYTSLFQEGTHTYLIESTFPDSEGKQVSAWFEKDGVFWPGDTRAGQISMTTSGISELRDPTTNVVTNRIAEVYVRADYVPRNITMFRFRFFPTVMPELTPTLTQPQRDALVAQLKNQLNAGAVEIAPEGLLGNWRIVNEGNGVFDLFTDLDNYLQFSAEGNLLKITFDGLGPDDVFQLGMRVDNTWYLDPGFTKYFMYPGSLWNPDGALFVGKESSVTGPAGMWADFELTPDFDPDAAGAWNRDNDNWEDFDDSFPDDVHEGDNDNDGTPDLNDPAPLDPNIP